MLAYVGAVSTSSAVARSSGLRALLRLVVWLGPSAVVVHFGAPPGYPGFLYDCKRNNV
jgi:hypothetical protein